MRNFARLLLFATLFVAPLCAMAQNDAAKATPPTIPVGENHDDYLPVTSRMYIKLSFTMSEVDEHGKVINTRRFEGMTYAHPQGHNAEGSISMGARVPLFDKDGHTFSSASLGSTVSYRRLYVIDDNHVGLSVEASLDSILAGETADHPVNRNNRWSGDVLMPIGERKVIFSSDDLASKHVLQLDLLVTRVR